MLRMLHQGDVIWEGGRCGGINMPTISPYSIGLIAGSNVWASSVAG